MTDTRTNCRLGSRFPELSRRFAGTFSARDEKNKSVALFDPNLFQDAQREDASRDWKVRYFFVFVALPPSRPQLLRRHLAIREGHEVHISVPDRSSGNQTAPRAKDQGRSPAAMSPLSAHVEPWWVRHYKLPCDESLGATFLLPQCL